MIYHQTTLENPVNNIAPIEPPDPAPVADWDNDDTCASCGAESGISGAHDHAGAWWHVPAILTRYGFTFPDMERYPEVFAEPITQTRLVNGVCQWCRAKGGA